jgi:transposase
MQLSFYAAMRSLGLILDNLTVHHGKIVREWCGENADRIELFFLPAYSPEKNPDEYLNCDLKRGLSDRPSPKDAKALTGNVKDHMEMLQTEPERVKSYFKHSEIAYAA